MESFDAIIVGGGPAGSSCAWKLVRGGLIVLVLDKKAFPRVKPCAGWITPQVVESLQLDEHDYRAGRVWQPITGFRCGVIGGRDVEVRYERPISFGIRRYEFDDYLLRRSGAALSLAESVEAIERDGETWVINGRCKAPLLIGAGGHFCPVARRLGARPEAAAVVYAQEAEYQADPEASGSVSAQMPALYFCPDLLGYGWCFRKADYLNVGLGRLDAKGLSSHVAAFCD
ncbi:MAG TPA: FAD-dependent monooxygenase, partial [Pirellulaceae bacterium]|nr:FAD-dependent monooxygenase [Pirellulaceae bacterium]